MSSGLARVTISAPQRRVDVALPEHVPLAELLPEVLRHAGEGLADDGERHGGWLLRRTDGAGAADRVRACFRRGYATARCCTSCRPGPSGRSWSTTTWSRRSPTGARRRGTAWIRRGHPDGQRWPAAAVLLAVGLFAVLAAGPGTRTAADRRRSASRCCSRSPAWSASRAYGDAPAGAALGGVRAAVRVRSAVPCWSHPGDPVGVLAPVRWLGGPGGCWPARWRCCWSPYSARSGWPPGCGSSRPAPRSACSVR